MTYKTKKKRKRESRNSRILENSARLIILGTAIGVAGKMVSNMGNK